MIYVYFFFAAILIWLSYRSFRGGIVYERFLLNGLTGEVGDGLPFATVFAPCRGVDRTFDENLERLFTQAYPAYEILFIVDDKGDAAVEKIEDAIGRHAGRGISARLLIAPKAVGSSQKIANLLFAIRQADERSEVFAFVDSDACTRPDWLASLAAAAMRPGVGAATGYRWLISENGKLGSELASVWNASVASALGPNLRSNFCWGGSMAARRSTFEQIGVAEKWEGALSDDFAMTRAVHDAGLDLVFVPRALCASFEHQTLAEMLEFTTRQMKITRVYSPNLWLLSMFGSTLFCSVMIASIAIIAAADVRGIAFFAAIATFGLVTAFTLLKAIIRLRAVRAVLSEQEVLLKRQFLPQPIYSFVTPAIFLVNTVLAAISRRIVWRGTVYELKSPSETVIIREKR
ncbi:MAG: glycosyltransferase [Acidobacteria bacterium]|nr:glycosyltransferase [Acidobacteriota bacterium]